MGKFTGLLLASDYDNTLTYTEEALRLCQPMPPVPDANQEAIRYFMSEGGIFSVATGRAKPAFERVAADVPMNGPTILFNGAAIYDFPAGKYLCEAFLPDEAKDCIQQVIGALPFSAVELYHDNNDIHALQPNDVTRRHLHITHSPTVFVDSMTEVPSPISKALFSTEPENQPALLDFLRAEVGAVDAAQVERFRAAELLQFRQMGQQLLAGGADGQGRQQGRHGPPPGGAAGHPAGECGLRRGPRQRHLHAELGGYGLRPRQRAAPGVGPAPGTQAAGLPRQRHRRPDSGAGRKILSDTFAERRPKGRLSVFFRPGCGIVHNFLLDAQKETRYDTFCNDFVTFR